MRFWSITPIAGFSVFLSHLKQLFLPPFLGLMAIKKGFDVFGVLAKDNENETTAKKE